METRELDCWEIIQNVFVRIWKEPEMFNVRQKVFTRYGRRQIRDVSLWGESLRQTLPVLTKCHPFWSDITRYASQPNLAPVGISYENQFALGCGIHAAKRADRCSLFIGFATTAHCSIKVFSTFHNLKSVSEIGLGLIYLLSFQLPQITINMRKQLNQEPVIYSAANTPRAPLNSRKLGINHPRTQLIRAARPHLDWVLKNQLGKLSSAPLRSWDWEIWPVFSHHVEHNPCASLASPSTPTVTNLH